MGVNVREKPTGSGIWWVFANHKGERKSLKVGRDKKTALKIAKVTEARLVLGDLDIDDFNKKVPTLKKYAEKWFSLPHKTGKGTMHTYKRNLELHVYPVLGNRPLDQLKRKDFKDMFNDLLTKGMAESNFQNIKSPLSRIFHEAMDDQLVQVNPLAGLSYSKASKIDIKPLTEEEVFTFLDAAKEYEGGRYYPIFLTLLRTGMRIGEALGLQWQDIDFKWDPKKKEGRQIHIQRHMVKNVAKPGTKNGKTRTVDMTPVLSDTLRALKREKQKEALKTGRPFCQYCFAMGDKTEPVSSQWMGITMPEILKLAGLPKMRIHDLRHTYATIRIMNSHNIADVSYQMGHSSIKITIDTYTHWKPGRFKSEVDKLDLQPDATQTQPQENENG